jgi:four helix bundle suffix protein
MVQAARSGVQNIAEGSEASGNVARASLEELRLDYEDFLRQRELEQWEPGHPASVPSSAQLVTNAVLSLLNQTCHLLNRQLQAQAAAFVQDGGFAERLHRVRSRSRPPRQ